MSKLLLAAALAITISAASQPAFAFGPGGFGRDLIYTSAIGHVPVLCVLRYRWIAGSPSSRPIRGS